MTKLETLQLKLTATRVRMGVIEATHGAGCGHPGGSLSAADVLTYLYFREMRIDPEQPQDPNRDRFVLSKGHCAPGLYATLAERGFFPVADLPTLRHSNSYLQGHPNMNTVPGVDMSTGSLGQGVSAACGMALGAKKLGSDINVYTLLGDGEIEEGECWEAFMFANHYKLDNLCIMIDVNGLQIDGATRDVMNSARWMPSASTPSSATATPLPTWSRRSRCSTCPTAAASPPVSCCARPRVWASATWKTPSIGTARPPTTKNTPRL